ncbi:MAG: alpha-L-fucosidase [Prevotellaceae bacterium]|nr:alpha-L-fucosidase [Prevotellaceae bacterium]
MGTFQGEDWVDPDVPVLAFNPSKLDCRQWIDAAESANMKFGCMSVKHHCGFCMWNTATTDYNSQKSAAGRDVVKEFCDALHEKDMKVMFHFSILDMHEKILPHNIKRYQIDFIKEQLRELLTNYGPVTVLMIDGWDAPWSRLSYEDICFEEIYRFCKRIQPECLVMDLNGAQYPAEALFYSDLKTYEQGVGQRIEKESCFLPSMACYPIQRTWFWKEDMPSSPTKSPVEIVKDNLVPMNEACCTFILNVAPNRDGLFDRNAVEALHEIGKLWKDDGIRHTVAETGAPIIATNLAKNKHAIVSWSYDSMLHDFATDDNFSSPWISHNSVKKPWLQVELGDTQPVNAVVITDRDANAISSYRIECRSHGKWQTLFDGKAPTSRCVKINRFNTVYADAVKLTVTAADGQVQIHELGVYNEPR